MTADRDNQQAARELLPCPFCGGEPYEHAIEPHTHSPFLKNLGIPDHGGSHVIECGCGAGLIDDTREAVIAIWNKRAVSRRGEWIDWFEEWGRQNDINLHRVRDGRLLSPYSAIAELAYLSACMTSAIYYMELDRPTPPDSGETNT